MRHLRIAAFATAVGAALGAASAAHATFVIDTSCGVSQCDAGTKFFIDTANNDVATFGGTVQGNAITVDTTGNVDTGSGFATIKPTSGATLTDLIFTPSDDTLFSDFSFRGQLEPVGFTGMVCHLDRQQRDKWNAGFHWGQRPELRLDRKSVV